MLVLVGNTKEARHLLWLGKVKFLVDYGISEEVARVCARMPSGMIVEVAQLAEWLVDVVSNAGPFEGGSKSDFNRWAGRRVNMSPGRRYAAVAIAAEVVEIRLRQAVNGLDDDGHSAS